MRSTFLLCSLILLFTSCEKQLTPIGNHSIAIFNQTKLNFDMKYKELEGQGVDSILRLDAGRVILKKITLPQYQIQPSIQLNISLTSNGDPWDKSGSFFIVPKSSHSKVSLIDFENGNFDLTQFNTIYPAVKDTLFYDSIKYSPNIELMRFMTPFGVGYFNDKERIKKRKPVYIPRWEDEVSWTTDLTHLADELTEEVYVGAFIDTWTKEGYKISAKLEYIESTIPQHQKKQVEILPLINTVKYASGQRNYDLFSRHPLSVDFSIPQSAKNVKLHYTTTGHGGHAEGDEFVKRKNIISIDDQILFEFTPWRDDCASFRRFNPTSGVWSVKVDSTENSKRENLASSDLSRSNWCPGSMVKPEIIPLDHLPYGDHTLSIAIPEAQARAEGEENYWMVSAYISYEKDKS